MRRRHAPFLTLLFAWVIKISTPSLQTEMAAAGGLVHTAAEAVNNAAFGPLDRIGQLTMRNLDIADSRAKLEIYASQPVDQGQLLVENGTLFGELPAGGATRIEANPAADDEAALESAAMEFGAD